MNKDSVPKKLAASFRELVKKSSVEKITIEGDHGWCRADSAHVLPSF